MTQRPILFSTPMVQAILEGRKTMTRRIISKTGFLEQYSKAELDHDVEVCQEDDWDKTKVLKGPCAVFDHGEWSIKYKYNVGDILWVRETWKQKRFAAQILEGYDYKANHVTWLESRGQLFTKNSGCETDEHWKPSIFMPRAACRIFLEITDITVERLNDISTADCVDEGIEKEWVVDAYWYKNYSCIGIANYKHDPYPSFKSLWESINGDDSWESNPWVWVIKFKQVSKQITKRC